MPPMGSSSSSDEDLSMFRSVAVIADDIAESARKEAESAKRRKSAGSAAAAGQPSNQAANSARELTAVGSRANPETEQLDLTSLRIAAALDAMLARQLEDNAATAADEAAAADTATDHPADTTPTAAADAAAPNDADEDAGVRLFRRVAPGTACVMVNYEYGNDAAAAAAGADPAQLHLHPQSQKYISVRELIPRFNLAADSSSSNKRQHEQILAALAVDGDALLASAAAAPGTAWQQQQQQEKGKGSKPSAVAGAGTSASWQHMKKRKVEGVVVNAKEFVAHDVRMAKLLGQPPPVC